MVDINPSRPDKAENDDRALTLSNFAQLNQITEDRVWELIEEGELAARFVNDEILILREQETVPEPEVEPCQPTESMALANVELATPKDADFLPIRPEPEPFSELDKEQPDVPGLPSDDHRDLLMFAQDAMNRTMDLSRQLLATKDELMRLKDEKIQQQQGELQRNAQEIRRLKKKIEDLETLCRMAPRI